MDSELGERVRARRLAIGMSQETLADLLGVTFQQIQKYEKGVNRIAASRLWAIAAALEVPVASFFDGLGATKGQAKSSSNEALATPGAEELLRVYASIRSAKLRRKVLDLVRAMDQDN